MAFDEMAAKRENEASQLKDEEIWINIISKFVLLDLPVENRIQMIKQATGGNLKLIKSTLRTCRDREILNQSDIKEIMANLS